MFLAAGVPDRGAVPREDPERLVRDVGARVAELRKAAGFTQAAFAEAMGASVQYVSRIELGHENLTLHTLAKIAGVLGVEAIELLEKPSQPASPAKRGRPRKAVD